MEVYIEDVVLDNLLIDFLILLITAKLLHIKVVYWRLILASFIGVVFTVLNLIVALGGVVLLVYKLSLGLLMCILAFGEKTIKRNLLNYITFLFVTFLVGGACFLVCFSFGTIAYGEGGTVAYEIGLPLGIIAMIICIITFFIFSVISTIKQKNEMSNFVFETKICNNNYQICTRAFLDTGNTLFDPITNKPVIIINYEFFKKLNKDVKLHEILLNRLPKEVKSPHYIEVNSVSGKSNMLIFTMDCVKITKNKFNYIIYNAVFGLTFAKLEQNLDCPILISPALLNGGYY